MTGSLECYTETIYTLFGAKICKESYAKCGLQTTFLGNEMDSSFLCRLFGHKFDSWKYIEDKECIQEGICTRCDYTEKRVHHKLGDWKYTEEKKCKQVRRCTRCDYTEKRVHHYQSKKVFVEGLGSVQFSKDAADPSVPENIVFGKYSYVYADHYESICTRCGETLAFL